MWLILDWESPWFVLDGSGEVFSREEVQNFNAQRTAERVSIPAGIIPGSNLLTRGSTPFFWLHVEAMIFSTFLKIRVDMSTYEICTKEKCLNWLSVIASVIVEIIWGTIPRPTYISLGMHKLFMYPLCLMLFICLHTDGRSESIHQT